MLETLGFVERLRSNYAATKHALIGFADALRAEMAAAKVQVSVITPGYVRTNVARNALLGDGSVSHTETASIEAGMDPDVAAQTMVAALAAGQREIVVAQGFELQAVGLKRTDPEKNFDLVETL